jgi:hypothetical protein
MPTLSGDPRYASLMRTAISGMAIAASKTATPFSSLSRRDRVVPLSATTWRIVSQPHGGQQ